MGKKHLLISSFFVAFCLSILVTTPVARKIEHQDTQIKTVTLMSEHLQTSLVRNQADLEASQAQAQADLKRKDEELANARQQIDKLKKEADAARAPRPAVRLAEPSVKPADTEVEVKAQVKVGSSGNCESYRPLVAKYFPAGQVNNALLTMRRESGCRSDAISPAGDYGLMQVHFAAHTNKVNSARALLSPETNIRVAAIIYRSGGWCQWVAVWGILC